MEPVDLFSINNNQVIKNPLITKKKRTPKLPCSASDFNQIGNWELPDEWANNTKAMLNALQPSKDDRFNFSF
jgi:hypothetical protein